MTRRLALIGAGLLVALAVLAMGAAGGAALTYWALQARPAVAQATPPDAGLLVAAVDPDGPAAQAGLRRADIVLEFDGQAVNTLSDLSRALAARDPGDRVALKIQRGDATLTLTATLGDREGRPYLGFTPCREGGPWARGGIAAFEIRPRAGVRVIEVLPDQPAEAAGLKVGDLITAVDGQALDAEHALAEVLAGYNPGDTVTLTVKRPGEAELMSIEVTLGEDPDVDGRAYLGIRYAPALAPGIEFGPAPFRDGPFGPGFNFSLPDGITEGVIIGEVTADSPAEAAGLKAGDVISAVDGEALAGPRALAEAVAAHEPGDRITLTVHRAGEDEPLSVEVTLGEHPDQAGKAYLGVRARGFFRIDRGPDDAPFRWPDLPEIPRHFPFDNDV